MGQVCGTEAVPIVEENSDFEEYFQKEEVASTMNEITNNPKVREISEALMKQYNEKKIDMNDDQKLYYEEIKKNDYDLYLKLRAMNAGIANVSKKS